MRELRACDFCGDDADGVYEPLPPNLGADQRRVALCGSCRDTLEELLAPLHADTGAVTADAEAGSGARKPDLRGDPKRTRGGESGSEPPARSEVDAAERSSADAVPSAVGGGASEGVAPDAERNETTAPEGTTGPNEGDSGGGEPPGFRKVMRLLNNRSFPLEYAVAVELASGAYDLSEAEVEATLEHAVERGVLEMDGAELRRA